VFKIRTTIKAAVLPLTIAASGACVEAQTVAPAPATDEPSIRLGAELFLDYTVNQQPKIMDSDGNSVTLSQFQVGRAYINVLGNISKTILFRVTPDIVRETAVGSSLNGSYTFRLKFAYAQWDLDGYLGKGA
jgi:hypothetical protein